MLVLTLLTGCSTDVPAEVSTPGQPDPAVTETTQQSETVSAAPPEASTNAPAVDRAGNPITVPMELERIISLAPATTQTVVHMGLSDKLVAIDTNSAIIEGIPEGLPTVDLLSPDTELLITLDADLVLCSAMTGYDGSEPLKPLSDAGVCIAVIPTSKSIDGIKEDLIFVADLVGRHDKGVSFIEELESGIQEIKDAVGGAAAKGVYFEIAAAPAAYSFGGGTFMNEMIEIAGGKNIFDDMDGWLAVSEEQLITRNPDVIFTNVNYIDDPVGEILSRTSLQGVAAVAGQQVFFVDNYASSLANEYVLTAIRQMAAAMHPDLWQNG
jgi:iron complex transport system substrate-binding protein